MAQFLGDGLTVSSGVILPKCRFIALDMRVRSALLLFGHSSGPHRLADVGSLRSLILNDHASRPQGAIKAISTQHA